MATVAVNPQPTTGPWIEGYNLDDHTISSEFLGYEGDYPRFNTRRTALGELIYQLKNRGGPADDIIETAGAFVREHWSGNVDCVIAPPPSLNRARQPAILIAMGIADSLGVAYKPDVVIKAVPTQQMKNVPSQQRAALLAKAIQPGTESVRGIRVLIVDDLWETGSTMRSVASVLRNMEAFEIRALAMTRTK